MYDSERYRRLPTIEEPSWMKRCRSATIPISYACKEVVPFSREVEVAQAASAAFWHEVGQVCQVFTRTRILHGYDKSAHFQVAGISKMFSKDHRGLDGTSCPCDRFLEAQTRKGWSRGTLASAASALKSFFQYAEDRRWCSRGVALELRTIAAKVPSI